MNRLSRWTGYLRTIFLGFFIAQGIALGAHSVTHAFRQDPVDRDDLQHHPVCSLCVVASQFRSARTPPPAILYVEHREIGESCLAPVTIHLSNRIQVVWARGPPLCCA